jgi:hypothetical protein
MMKKIVLLLVLLGPSIAHASCEQINNPDDRRYCRALRDRSLGDCAQIISKDQRSLCRSQVGTGGLGECAQIVDKDAREFCRAQFR